MSKAFVYGDNVDTDVIIPARYLNVTDVHELSAHCMEDIDATFVQKVQDGDVMVAGRNFGCGSSREHAPLVIKTVGIKAVVAHSFARIFYRNAINIGLPILECPEAVRDIEHGDQIEVDVAAGTITNITRQQTYSVEPPPRFVQKIIESGGLLVAIQEVGDAL